MRFSTALALFVVGLVETSAFVPRRPTLFRVSLNDLSLENPRRTREVLRATTVQENSTTTDAWIQQELEDLDKDQVLLGMEGEIAGVSSTLFPEENGTGETYADMLRVAPSSINGVVSVESPYSSHDEAFERLALKAEEIAQKCRDPVETHTPKVLADSGPTQAFLVLGIAIAATTLADPTAVTEVLSKLDLHGIDLSGLDFGGINLEGVTQDILRLVDELRDFVLTQVSRIDLSNLEGMKEDFVANIQQMENVILAKASSIDFSHLSGIDMEAVKEDMLEHVKQMQNMLQTSTTLQQMGNSVEGMKESMVKGLQDMSSRAESWKQEAVSLPQFSGINVEGMKEDVVKGMQDFFRAGTWNIDLDGMKQDFFGKIRDMQDSSILPPFASINMEGIKNDFAKGMQDIFRPDAFSINVGGVKDDFLGRVEELKGTILAKSSSIDFPQIGSVDGMKEEFLDRIREMQDMSSSITLPQFSGIDVDEASKSILGLIKETQDKVSNIDLPQFSNLNIEGMKETSLAKLSSVDLPELPSVNIEELKEDLVAKASSVNLPRFSGIDVDGMKEDVLTKVSGFGLPTVSTMNMDGLKEDFLRQIEHMHGILRVDTFLENHDDMIGAILDWRDMVLKKTSSVDLPQFSNLNIESMTKDFLGRVEDMRDIVGTKFSTVNLPQLPSASIEGMKENLLDNVKEFQDVAIAKSSSFELPKFDTTVAGPSSLLDSLNQLQDSASSSLDLSKLGESSKQVAFLLIK